MNLVVMIDKKQYKLAYTNEALCALEDLAPGDALNTMQQQRPAAFIRHMLWAALIANHPDTTLEQAGRLSDLYAQQNQGKIINGQAVSGRDALLFLIRDVQIASGLVLGPSSQGENRQEEPSDPLA